MGAALVGAVNVGFVWAKSRQIESEYPGVRRDLLVAGSAVMAVVAAVFGRSNILAGVALGALGFALGYVDARTCRIPTLLTALLTVQVLIYCSFELSATGFGVALTGAGLWLLAMVVGKATKTVGAGDVYLAPALGFFAGPFTALAVTITAVLVGFQALWAHRQGESRFAFGPALIGGAFIAWLVAG